jgi:hypothetical protein
MYYDLGRTQLDCPECGKPIEVTTLLRPRRGRKPGSTNAAPLTNQIPPQTDKKDEGIDIENLDLNTDSESLDDDSVLIEDDSDIDPTADVGIKSTDGEKEEL